MQSNPAFNSLIDMGCNPVLVKAAITKLKTEDLSALLDWISEHGEQEQKWSKWLQQNQGVSMEGEEKVQGKGQSISSLINKEFATQLQSRGHSKNVSQKSLLLTNNASVESAQAWIQQHKYDPDFEEQLMLTGNAFQESTLTEEQAKIKLKQLTLKARENRKKRQEEQERERQKNRVRYGKEMIQAKRIAEEQAVKRQLQLDKIQKKKDEDYKAKLVEQMRRQKMQKLGKKFEEGEQIVNPNKPKVQLNILEQLEVQCEQVKVGMHAYPEKAKVFFETAQIYVNNIIKNNGEQKFRKINKENKAFLTRISECFGGVQTLQVLGYKDENGFLIMKDYNVDLLNRASEIFGRYKAWY